MNKKAFLVLTPIFILAYLLRVMFLPDLALTFGYDQARDAFHARQIVDGDIKILGPPASTPGLHHGVLYYYILAPAYWIGQGSPIVAAYWIALLNALGVFIVYYLAYLMTRKHGAAILSAFFFAISFELTQYAAWLSNPTIGVWTVPIIYLGLWAWVRQRKNWGPVVTGLGLGLSIQADIFLVYHAVPVAIWLWYQRKKLSRVDYLKFSSFLLLATFTLVISEVKFGFRGFTGALSLLAAQDRIISSYGFGDFILLFFNQLGRVFAYSTYPGNVGYGGILVMAILVIAVSSWDRKSISWQPFLATWLLSHITVVSVGGASTPFLLVGAASGVCLLLGITLYLWWERNRKVLVVSVFALVVLGNIMMIFKENQKGQTIFAIQKDMVMSKQLDLIDYTYQEANGEPFSINSLTSPLWINIVWTYLYKWYGQPKYSYLPEWHGRDQVGQLDSLMKESDNTSLHYLILEPMAGIPRKYLNEAIAEEDGLSSIEEEKAFGELKVQKRKRIVN